MLVFIFIFGIFMSIYSFFHYLCHAILGKCTYIFLILIYECGTCRNLNFENNMQDTGKGTYLGVRNSGDGEMCGVAAS